MISYRYFLANDCDMISVKEFAKLRRESTYLTQTQIRKRGILRMHFRVGLHDTERLFADMYCTDGYLVKYCILYVANHQEIVSEILWAETPEKAREILNHFKEIDLFLNTPDDIDFSHRRWSKLQL